MNAGVMHGDGNLIRDAYEKLSKYGITNTYENDEIKEFAQAWTTLTNLKTGIQFTIPFIFKKSSTYKEAFEEAGFINFVEDNGSEDFILKFSDFY